MHPTKVSQAFELKKHLVVRVNVSDVSTATDSGHRDLVSAEVEQRVDELLNGQYCKSVMSKPMLRLYAGKLTVASDGLWKLLDGKVIIAALKECLRRFQDPDEVDKYTWTPKFVDHLENGVEYEQGEITDDDDDLAFQWAAGVHSEESNRFTPTSIMTLIRIGRNELAHTASGNDVEAARNALEAFY